MRKMDSFSALDIIKRVIDEINNYFESHEDEQGRAIEGNQRDQFPVG